MGQLSEQGAYGAGILAFGQDVADNSVANGKDLRNDLVTGITRSQRERNGH